MVKLLLFADDLLPSLFGKPVFAIEPALPPQGVGGAADRLFLRRCRAACHEDAAHRAGGQIQSGQRSTWWPRRAIGCIPPGSGPRC
jgi:hypothetical protein